MYYCSSARVKDAEKLERFVVCALLFSRHDEVHVFKDAHLKKITKNDGSRRISIVEVFKLNGKDLVLVKKSTTRTFYMECVVQKKLTDEVYIWTTMRAHQRYIGK